MAVIPLFFRMMQCYRAGRDKGEFLMSLDMWNFFKYTSSFLTALFSYLFKLYSYFFVYWIIFAAISTCYSYYWDLK